MDLPLPFELPFLDISPTFQGFLFPTELLKTEGSIQYLFQIEKTLEEHRDDLEQGRGSSIITIIGNEFLFAVGLGSLPIAAQDPRLYFARGEDVLSFPLSTLAKLGPELHVIVGWSRTTMLLSISRMGGGPTRSTQRFHGHSESSFVTTLTDDYGTSCLIAECQTPHYAPPSTLINWARKRGLLPIEEYKTETDFYARVFHALGSLEQKLENVREPSCFWDIQYEGNSVVKRSPKRERDLHSIIESVLSDHLFLSSIDVVPEHATSVGRLDFLLIGRLVGGKTAKVCVEFKGAHSRDFMHGLTHQLPAYMAAAGEDVGAYCALDFSGPWFTSNIDGLKRLAEVTVAVGSLGNQRHRYPIQYFVYSLGKSVPASQA